MDITQEASNIKLLPVFFFHGLTGQPADAENLEKACAERGHVLVPLAFCPAEKSTVSLHKQVSLAIEQIRSTVVIDERFSNGYVFIGFSQGGLLARAVVEEMDDHKVHTLISMAGIQSGWFYGPQVEDSVPLAGFLGSFGPEAMPSSGFDFARYRNDPSTWRGKVQRDLIAYLTERKDVQDEFSMPNLLRAPTLNDWVDSNTFLPMINNVNKCGSAKAIAEQQRRKNNFLKLKAAHFFASPGDDCVSPWQNSIFGRYNEVESLEKIETEFESLKIVDMHETTEYKEDSFGLKTLNERGGLHLHVVLNVPHCGWIVDTPLSSDPTQVCHFTTIFNEHIRPALP